MNGDGIASNDYAAELAREALDVSRPEAVSVLPAEIESSDSSPSTDAKQDELIWTSQLRTLADAYTEREPLDYLLKDKIAVGTLVIVFGAPGSLKSMLLADLAICVAAGLPWLWSMNGSGGSIATRQVPVLWLDLDNGRRRTDERFDAIGHARSLPAGTPLYYVTMPNPWLDASDKGLMRNVAEQVNQLGAKLVIIDNLGLICGAVRENDAEMASVMGSLRRLCEETGAAVLVVHHQRKSNGTVARIGESLRGHSSIEASLDLALHIHRTEGTDEVVITPTKMRGATFPLFGARFNYELRPDSKELAVARFVPSEVDDSGGDDEIDAVLLEVAKKDGELNKTSLKQAAKKRLPEAGINRIAKRIDSLVSEGRLASHEGTKGPTEKLISIPPSHDSQRLTDDSQ